MQNGEGSTGMYFYCRSRDPEHIQYKRDPVRTITIHNYVPIGALRYMLDALEQHWPYADVSNGRTLQKLGTMSHRLF